METIIFLIGIIIAMLIAYLQKLSQSLYQKKYAQHMIFEHPKKATDWHLFIYVLIWLTMFNILKSYYVITNEFWLGFLALVTIVISCRHLAAMCVYRHVIKHPDDIYGTTHFNADLSRLLSLLMTIVSIPFFLIIPFFEQTPFFIGTASGALTIFIASILNKNVLTIY